MSSLNLDDAATLLLQLDVTDIADLAILREALTDLAFENRVPLRAQPFVARAARVLGTIINHSAPDVPAAFADVSSAIAEAMRARDGSMPTRDRELLPECITECHECVLNSEAALLELEAFPGDDEAIYTVFRAFHTVKVTSAFLGLTRVAAFAHEAESLLSRVRDKEIAYSKACADDDMFPITTMSSPAVETATRGSRNQAHAESTADATIRVRTDRLDRLIDMVGELVIAQSMIAGDDVFDAGKQHDLLRKMTLASTIVRGLQDLSMSMRMVPLRATFQKLTRVVRDTATKASKTVQLVTEGDDVEIDRTMVRNAVDHGVEGPDEREANGKPRLGVVRLHAYHASGNVIVELKDDGRGLHRDKIVKKAIEKGLIDGDKSMTDSDVFNLIFAPGFSTAEQITDISGRGVGMDVVRRNIEKIRGCIDISSVPGHGTAFAVRLPLTQMHMSFRPDPTMLSTIVGRGEVVLLLDIDKVLESRDIVSLEAAQSHAA